MKKRNVLLGSIVLSGLLAVISTLTAAQQSLSRETQTEGTTANTAPDPVPNLQAVTYKVSTFARIPAEHNKLILLISTEPESFTRDKMLVLARQLNKDFPNEQRIYAVIFDSEAAVRNYDPAGGTYSMSKKLERGEYYLDRVKGRESINFSSRRGNPVDEIKITLSNGFTRAKKRKRVSS